MVPVRLQQFAVPKCDVTRYHTTECLNVKYFTEPSPLELHLLPDITIQRLSTAAACLFLVAFYTCSSESNAMLSTDL